MTKTKWYQFDQNNSGGSFEVDEMLCHRLFIEAPNLESAIDHAESLGVYFDGVDKGWDCECCGDRWYKPWSDEGMEFPLTCGQEWNTRKVTVYNTPKEYAQWYANNYGWTSPDARIFYLNGTVEEVFSNEKS